MKKVVIGSDHAGYKLKEKIKAKLGDQYLFLDMGTDSEKPVDYPKYAEWVATLVANDPKLLGVLVCGSGIGISIAANKVPGARAALAYTVKGAQLARQHNHANIVATAGREETMDDPIEIVKTFLETPISKDERHLRRVQMITDIEERNSR
jgi:ribose 5-phosphate isomerase B